MEELVNVLLRVGTASEKIIARLFAGGVRRAMSPHGRLAKEKRTCLKFLIFD
jgi:hypothetical protein